MRTARRFEGLGALLAVVLVLPPAGPAWPRALALALVLGVLPGWIVARRVLPGWSAAGRGMLAVTLSPFLTAAPAALLIVAGASVATAARLVGLAVAVLAVWEALRPRGTSAGRPAPAVPSERTPWWIAGCGVALALAFQLGNPALARRSDAGFHAAVTLAIARAGLPPEDPFFAGLRLLYFWGSHLWAALWLALAPGLAVWTPLVALDLLAACGALLGVCLVARRLGGGARAQWLAAGLALFGTAPFAWVWDVTRSFAGGGHGVADLGGLVTHGVDAALGSMSGVLHPSLVFAADKFMVVTPFALGLALLPAFVLALAELHEAPGAQGRGAALALGLVVGAALFLHAMVGMTLLACGTLVLLKGVLSPGDAMGRAGFRRHRAALALALAAPALALTPYLMAIAAGDRTAWALGLSRQAVYWWLLGGALVVPAGTAWLWRHRRTSPAARLIPALALALTAGGLFARLAAGNQSKFFNLLFLILSAPAAAGWLELHDRCGARARAALAAVLALAAVPTAGLCAWAYVAERGQAPREYQAPAPEARASLAWARDTLPESAVLVGRAIEQGEATTLAVDARRSLLWGSTSMAAKWAHPAAALEQRARAAAAIAEGAALAPADAAFALGLGRELVVVDRRAPEEPRAEFARRAARPPGRLRLLHLGPDLAFSRYPVAP